MVPRPPFSYDTSGMDFAIHHPDGSARSRMMRAPIMPQRMIVKPSPLGRIFPQPDIPVVTWYTSSDTYATVDDIEISVEKGHGYKPASRKQINSEKAGALFRGLWDESHNMIHVKNCFGSNGPASIVLIRHEGSNVSCLSWDHIDDREIECFGSNHSRRELNHAIFRNRAVSFVREEYQKIMGHRSRPAPSMPAPSTPKPAFTRHKSGLSSSLTEDSKAEEDSDAGGDYDDIPVHGKRKIRGGQTTSKKVQRHVSTAASDLKDTKGGAEASDVEGGIPAVSDYDDSPINNKRNVRGGQTQPRKMHRPLLGHADLDLEHPTSGAEASVPEESEVEEESSEESDYEASPVNKKRKVNGGQTKPKKARCTSSVAAPKAVRIRRVAKPAVARLRQASATSSSAPTTGRVTRGSTKNTSAQLPSAVPASLPSSSVPAHRSRKTKDEYHGPTYNGPDYIARLKPDVTHMPLYKVEANKSIPKDENNVEMVGIKIKYHSGFYALAPADQIIALATEWDSPKTYNKRKGNAFLEFQYFEREGKSMGLAEWAAHIAAHVFQKKKSKVFTSMILNFYKRLGWLDPYESIFELPAGVTWAQMEWPEL